MSVACPSDHDGCHPEHSESSLLHPGEILRCAEDDCDCAQDDNSPAPRPPVRVCYVIDRLGIAGTETQLLKLIRGLDRARVKPFLCLLDGRDSLSRCLEPDDCPVLRLGIRALGRPSTLRRAWQFTRHLRRERIDIVQVHFPDSTYFAAPLARLAGVRHVVRTRRDLGYWMQPIDRRLGPLLGRLVTATIANCEACRQAVIDQERAAPESVVVLPNGIDLNRLVDLPAISPGSGTTPLRVGMVANLRPVKGPEIFIQAAGIVAREHPDVRFQIVGTGDEATARRWMHACGLEDRCHLYGSVRDVANFLGKLDVAVLASHSEGLSNSLLEYMATARPIVATSVGANPELIENGRRGLLVPPGDPAAMADAISRLLGDRPLAAQLGEAAREYVRERYSVEEMVRRYEEFYLQLLRTSPTGGNS